jgi:hypothetical protein
MADFDSYCEVDEWLDIMDKLVPLTSSFAIRNGSQSQGFINPSVVPPTNFNVSSKQFRLGKIFAAWLGKRLDTKLAMENGAVVGKMIAERAAHKSVKLRDVAGCMIRTTNFYLNLVEKMMEGQTGLTENETIDGAHEMQVAKMMMILFTVALAWVESACNKEENAHNSAKAQEYL